MSIVANPWLTANKVILRFHSIFVQFHIWQLFFRSEWSVKVNTMSVCCFSPRPTAASCANVWQSFKMGLPHCAGADFLGGLRMIASRPKWITVLPSQRPHLPACGRNAVEFPSRYILQVEKGQNDVLHKWTSITSDTCYPFFFMSGHPTQADTHTRLCTVCLLVFEYKTTGHTLPAGSICLNVLLHKATALMQMCSFCQALVFKETQISFIIKSAACTGHTENWSYGSFKSWCSTESNKTSAKLQTNKINKANYSQWKCTW